MSVSVLGAVWKLDLPKEQKYVLLAFADIADDAGYCWPSISHIAWKCGYSQRRRCADVVKKLIDSGVLSIVEKAQGRRTAMYQVRPWVAAQLEPFKASDYYDRSSAKKAPHENDEGNNDLNVNALSGGEKSSGAKMAPQAGSGAETAPQRPVDKNLEVPSAPRRGAISATVEVPSAPHYSSKTHQDPLALGAPAMGPGSGAKTDPALLTLNNSARVLGIPPRQPAETVDEFRRRVDAEHHRRMQATLKRRDAERRQQAAAEAEAETEQADASA